jgi:hypothetical protein
VLPVEERRKGGEGQEPGGSPETIPVKEGVGWVGVVASMLGCCPQADELESRHHGADKGKTLDSIAPIH